MKSFLLVWFLLWSSRNRITSSFLFPKNCAVHLQPHNNYDHASSSLAYSNSPIPDENADALRRRMNQVRQLQENYYQSTTSSSSNSRSKSSNQQEADFNDLTASTTSYNNGQIRHLPLWRVQWNELPGRTNVLNVHDPIYTHMFETILHSNSRYFGHLYMAENNDGKKNATSLTTYPKYKDNDHDTAAAVLGTLLRVADYRRMADGRLLLLVQAMERIVVTQIKQDKPYAIANVQVLPDLEEMDDSSTTWFRCRTEPEVEQARAMANQESFQIWHSFEFENSTLDLPQQNDLPVEAVVGSALAKVLPYVPYQANRNVEALYKQQLDASSSSFPVIDNSLVTQDPILQSMTLEERLIRLGILKHPVLGNRYLQLSHDELEYRIWLALDDFLSSTKRPVSPILLGLIPQHVIWPTTFQLQSILKSIQQTNLEHKCVVLPSSYPALRRQKRLSYSVAALMESIDTKTKFRQDLLSIPTTKERLAFILQQLETEWGSFQ